MKIPCVKCGADNDLGRVFCAGCGQKLDLSQRTAARDIERGRSSGFLKKLAGALFAFLVLAVIAGAVLAIWPAGSVVDNTGEKRGAIRVSQLITQARATLKSAQTGAQFTLPFTEKEINAFLDRKCESLGFNSMTVNIFNGGFVIRLESPGISLPFQLPGMASNQLPFTRIVRARFVRGRPVFDGMRFGHLPLFGVMRASTRAQLAEIAADFTGEPELVESLKEVKLEDDKAELLFQK